MERLIGAHTIKRPFEAVSQNFIKDKTQMKGAV